MRARFTEYSDRTRFVEFDYDFDTHVLTGRDAALIRQWARWYKGFYVLPRMFFLADPLADPRQLTALLLYCGLVPPEDWPVEFSPVDGDDDDAGDIEVVY
jgi:hypothetical protein